MDFSKSFVDEDRIYKYKIGDKIWHLGNKKQYGGHIFKVIERYKNPHEKLSYLISNTWKVIRVGEEEICKL